MPGSLALAVTLRAPERAPFIVRAAVLAGYAVGLYRRRWRYGSFDEVAALVLASLAAPGWNVRIGVPTSRPNWVSERPRSFLIWMPMMAKIVQTAKQTVKANVDSQSARL